MSEHTATVRWECGAQIFTDGRYSRGHTWAFDGGVTVPASASPHVVRLPLSVAEAVDPEEAFVAALASCHMLWFLSIAAARGFRVESYEDEAIGRIARDASGRLAITTVTLRPRVAFSGDRVPTAAELDAMHHQSHEECFIAASVRTDVRCEPRSPAA
jgi:organic hydroperoxide reductase OsmC/OhrA